MSVASHIPGTPQSEWRSDVDDADLHSHRILMPARAFDSAARTTRSNDGNKATAAKAVRPAVVTDEPADPLVQPASPSASSSPKAPSQPQSFLLSEQLYTELARWTEVFRLAITTAPAPSAPTFVDAQGVTQLRPVPPIGSLPLASLLPSARGLVSLADCKAFLARWSEEDDDPRINCEGWLCAVVQALLRRARMGMIRQQPSAASRAFVPSSDSAPVHDHHDAAPAFPSLARVIASSAVSPGSASPDPNASLPATTCALLSRLQSLLPAGTGDGMPVVIAPPPMFLLDAFYMFRELAHVPSGQGFVAELRLGAADTPPLATGLCADLMLMSSAHVRPRYFRHICRLMRLRPAHVHNLLCYFYDAPAAADVMRGHRKLDMVKLTDERRTYLQAARFIAKWIALAMMADDDSGSNCDKRAAAPAVDRSLSPDDTALLNAYRRLVEYLEDHSIAHTLADASVEESVGEAQGDEDKCCACSTARWFFIYLALTLIFNLGAMTVDAWIQAIMQVRREGLYKEWKDVRRFVSSRRCLRLLLSTGTVLCCSMGWTYLSYAPCVFFLRTWLSSDGLSSVDGVVTSKVVYLAPAAINIVACLCASAGMARVAPMLPLQLRHRTRTSAVLNQRQLETSQHLTGLTEDMELVPIKQATMAATRLAIAQSARSATVKRLRSAWSFVIVSVARVLVGSLCLCYIWAVEIEFGFKVFQTELTAKPAVFPGYTCANLTSIATQEDIQQQHATQLPGCLHYHCQEWITSMDGSETRFSSRCALPAAVVDVNVYVTIWLIVFLCETLLFFPLIVYKTGHRALKRLKTVRSISTYSRTAVHLSFDHSDNINAYLLLVRDLQVELRGIMQYLEPLLAFNALIMLGSTLVCGVLVVFQNIHALFFFFLPFALLGSVTMLFSIAFVAALNGQFAQLGQPMEHAQHKLNMALTLKGDRTAAREMGWNCNSSEGGGHADHDSDSAAKSLSPAQLAMLGPSASSGPASPWFSIGPTVSPPSAAVRSRLQLLLSAEDRLLRLRAACSYFALHFSDGAFTLFGVTIGPTQTKIVAGQVATALFAGFSQLVTALKEGQA